MNMRIYIIIDNSTFFILVISMILPKNWSTKGSPDTGEVKNSVSSLGTLNPSPTDWDVATSIKGSSWGSDNIAFRVFSFSFNEYHHK